MLRTVIIDDEPVLVRSLQTMIERADNQFQVVGTANDGVTGLELIGELEPDLVFADISMPVLDGLHLIEQLRNAGDTVPVVILSGYKEFAYAQQAVRLDVLDYLVKPINPIEFKDFLRKISEKLRTDRHEEIRRMLQLTLRSSEPYRSYPAWTHDLRFDCWKICFGVFSYYRKMGVDAEGEKLQRILLTALNETCKGKNAWILETRYPNEFNLCFISTVDEEPKIREIFDACRAQLSDQAVSIALGGKNIAISGINAAMKNAGTVLQAGAKFCCCEILAEAKPVKKGKLEELEPLTSLLRKMEYNQAELLLHHLLCRLEAGGCTQADLTSVLKQILRGCGRTDLESDADYHVSLLLEQSHSYGELEAGLKMLLLDPDAKDEFKLNERSSRAIIDTVAAFLASHASQRISLQAVAEEYGFNYTYLSYLFKKTLGRSPSEYLIQCRIEYAKHLLLGQEETSIKEISGAVGYDDPYYFSRLFKTATGLSPSEYRRQNGK